MDDFADWLRSAREAAGLSQGELAQACKGIDEDCKVHQPRISEWEGRKGLPELRQLGLLALALKLDRAAYVKGRTLLERASLSGLPVPGHDPSASPLEEATCP